MHLVSVSFLWGFFIFLRWSWQAQSIDFYFLWFSLFTPTPIPYSSIFLLNLPTCWIQKLANSRLVLWIQASQLQVFRSRWRCDPTETCSIPGVILWGGDWNVVQRGLGDGLCRVEVERAGMLVSWLGQASIASRKALITPIAHTCRRWVDLKIGVHTILGVPRSLVLWVTLDAVCQQTLLDVFWHIHGG